MDDRKRIDAQQQIIEALHVAQDFDVAQEIARRTNFLREQLIDNGMRSLVLGISGGVDSLVAGMLAQAAATEARRRGHEARFIAMRLPYGVQRDEDDAQRSLALINPDELLSVDIKPASDAMLAAVVAGGCRFENAEQEDFVLGNIKARERMIAQYAVAGARRGLVIGTDHAAEALMGFFTKHGDGAADVTPLTGLNKRRVRALAAALGAPDALVVKAPTADLENLHPQKPDEEAFGVSYDAIDDFLEGKQIADRDAGIILAQYHATAHKRRLPASP